MRATFPLFLLLSLGIASLGCAPSDKPTDPGDTDTDTDTDDTDTDEDTDKPGDAVGDDIESAMELEFSEDGDVTYSDAIDYGGDRDFYFIQPEVGNMVVAFSAAYIHREDGMPDTVLRLYDSAGNFLGENDDFPYWSWGTDSGMIWQAIDPDGYYVEILEWSDWAGESPSGGSSYVYDFHAWQMDMEGFEWADNGDMESADAQYDTWEESEDLAYYYWLFGDVASDQTYSIQMFGEIDEPGDEDWWVIDVEAESEGHYLHVAFWNEYVGNLSPVLSAYDQQGRLLAQTTNPGYSTGSQVWYYDPGLIFRVPTAGRYYLVVEDAAGAGGAGEGYFYPLIWNGPWYFTTEIWEVEPNHPIGVARTVTMTESSNYAGYYYGTVAGALDSVDDESDNFKVLSNDVGGLSGKFVSVYVETARYGSLLDAKLTLYEDVGSGDFNELASATVCPSGELDDDPAIWDFELDSDNNIYVSIEHETGADDADQARFYFASVVVYDEPVN